MSSYGVAWTRSGVYSDRICSRPSSMTFHSSSVSTPHPRSERAWARLARMSTSRRTASVPSDRFIFSKTGSLSSSNRPCHSFILIHHQPRSNRCRQTEKIDKALGVVMIVRAGVKRCDVLSIQAEWRYATLHSHRAFVQAHCNGAGHDFLCLVEESVECFTEGSKPLAFVDHLGVCDRENIFLISGLAIQHERFEFAMRRGDQRPAWRFVHATRFHSDDAIFDAIGTADAVGSGNLVQIFE